MCIMNFVYFEEMGIFFVKGCFFMIFDFGGVNIIINDVFVKCFWFGVDFIGKCINLCLFNFVFLLVVDCCCIG